MECWRREASHYGLGLACYFRGNTLQRLAGLGWRLGGLGTGKEIVAGHDDVKETLIESSAWQREYPDISCMVERTLAARPLCRCVEVEYCAENIGMRTSYCALEILMVGLASSSSTLGKMGYGVNPCTPSSHMAQRVSSGSALPLGLRLAIRPPTEGTKSIHCASQ